MQYSTALLCLLVFLSRAFSKPDDNYELELVQVLFRHGDRTPTNTEMYPKDPYNETIYEPFGIGQLTNKGKQRIYHLGRLLKKRYVKFLGGEAYEPGLVYGYSTNVDRTKMSLQLALAGLFPPTKDFQWNDHVNWIPVPVHYNFDSYDFMWTAYHCPEFEKIWNTTVALPAVQRKLDEYRDFIEYLANSTGLPNDPQIAINLHENIHAQKKLGYAYPAWCDDDIYAKLSKISAFRYDVYVYTDLMKKIAVGPTIRRFLRNIEINNDNDNPKIYLYSGHDDNVATFIRTHELATLAPRASDYGSAVVFEKLRGNNDSSVYVRLLYYSGIGDDFQILKLKHCDKICPHNRYMKIMKPVLPSDDGTRCLYEEALRDVKNVIDGAKPSRPANALELKYAPL